MFAGNLSFSYSFFLYSDCYRMLLLPLLLLPLLLAVVVVYFILFFVPSPRTLYNRYQCYVERDGDFMLATTVDG